jgi:hypothetical protein
MRSYGHHFPFGDKELHQLGTAAAAAAFAGNYTLLHRKLSM